MTKRLRFSLQNILKRGGIMDAMEACDLHVDKLLATR